MDRKDILRQSWTSINWGRGCLNKLAAISLYLVSPLCFPGHLWIFRRKALRLWGLVSNVRHWNWWEKGQKDRESGRDSLFFMEDYLFRQESSFSTGKSDHSPGSWQEAASCCVQAGRAGLCWLPGIVKILAPCRGVLQKVISQNWMFL